MWRQRTKQWIRKGREIPPEILLPHTKNFGELSQQMDFSRRGYWHSKSISRPGTIARGKSFRISYKHQRKHRCWQSSSYYPSLKLQQHQPIRYLGSLGHSSRWWNNWWVLVEASDLLVLNSPLEEIQSGCCHVATRCFAHWHVFASFNLIGSHKTGAGFQDCSERLVMLWLRRVPVPVLWDVLRICRSCFQQDLPELHYGSLPATFRELCEQFV